MKERCLNKKFLYVYLEFYIYTHIILTAHAREDTNYRANISIL
jgi:hypothetical protein